jgi:hypothetical protein
VETLAIGSIVFVRAQHGAARDGPSSREGRNLETRHVRRSYYLPVGRAFEQGAPHPHPERTAYRSGVGVFSEFEFKIWASRAAMLQACAMSEKGVDSRYYWKPLQKAPSPAAWSGTLAEFRALDLGGEAVRL